MPTTDPSNVLFKIAHPDLYERNPFNLLNLPINASAKDIRRRKEDIEAAFEAGTEAEEFKYVLPLDNQRKPPTQDAVHEAFDALNDPEMRIAYSLFWFWPVGDGSKTGNPNREVANWITSFEEDLEANMTADGIPIPLLGRHNLAVMHHQKLLTAELQLCGKMKSARFYDKVFKHWASAIRLWNALVSDADFWHSVSEQVSSLNDPRLDYRFARSLRDQFAFAFDQINVELAIAFAKTGRESDAKRQVEYMKLSQPDTDDVEGTFDDAFAGLQKQVEAIVNAAREEANSNPKRGLAKVDEILERTKEPVQISRIIFDKGEPIRESVITTIFAGVRNCMIAYGNETNDWDGCLKRIDALKALAENDRQVTLVAEDERIIVGNKQAKEEVETCWFCKQKYDISRPRRPQTVNLWGNMRMGAQFGQVTFSQRSIEVPMCHVCACSQRPSNHPLVKKFLNAGWNLGTEPSQEEIRKFWGIPKPIEPSPQPVQSGCLIPIVIGAALFILLIYS